MPGPLVEIVLLVILLLLFRNEAFAQKKITTLNQQWIQSYHEAKVSEKWTFLLDGGYRWREDFSKSAAYIVRTGMGYTLSPKIRISAGFAHLGFYSQEEVIRREYRPHQEMLFRTPLKKVNFSTRFRIEERFYKNEENVNFLADLNFNFRFRLQVMFGIPVWTFSPKNPDRILILNLGNELFLNSGKQVASQPFDQNRLLISPTLQWSKAMNIGFTYNRQYASTADPNNFLLSNVAWLQIRYNPSLMSKK